MTVTAFDVGVFAAEMACYASVAAAGWRVHPAVGVTGVVVMAAWWGGLHSPKARVRLPSAVDRPLRVAWFAVGVGAAVRLLV